MRKVVVSDLVMEKLALLDFFMQHELKFSKPTARRRIARIDEALAALAAPVSHALCRFRRWREAGLRCIVFEGWVFAYEVFDDGVIIRDMTHGKLIDNATD